MFEKILVVCVGNICRSPLAQFQLQSYLPGRNVASAGLAAVVGRDMDKSARAVASAHGLDIPLHKAQQLTPELCRWADLILVMERGHIDEVSRMSPASRGKIFLLGAGGWGGGEIPDPYGRPSEVFDQVHNLISSGAKMWARKLGANIL